MEMEINLIYDDVYCDNQIEKINKNLININELPYKEKMSIMKRSLQRAEFGNNSIQDSDILICLRRDLIDCLCHKCNCQ